METQPIATALIYCTIVICLTLLVLRGCANDMSITRECISKGYRGAVNGNCIPLKDTKSE